MEYTRGRDRVWSLCNHFNYVNIGAFLCSLNNSDEWWIIDFIHIVCTYQTFENKHWHWDVTGHKETILKLTTVFHCQNGIDSDIKNPCHKPKHKGQNTKISIILNAILTLCPFCSLLNRCIFKLWKRIYFTSLKVWQNHLWN